MLFIQHLFKNPSYFFMVCLIVTFSVCFHEFCHAWIATREGDYTLEDHLTLNPLKQMGITSLIMLAIVGIAWGTVPVHSELLRSRKSLLKISLAGPAANLFLLILAWGVLLLFSCTFHGEQISSTEKVVFMFIYIFGIYNFVLFVFNLLPVPGLDGWVILCRLFPKLNNVSSEWIKGAMMLVMLLAFMGVRFLFAAGETVMKLALLCAGFFMGA